MNRVIAVLVLSVITQLIIAQDDHSKHEKIEHLKAQKVAFLTERIGLSSADAQTFWPVYNQYSAKKDSLSEARWSERKKLKGDLKKLSASEKERSIDRQIQLKWEEEKMEYDYHKKFKKILSIDQLIKLYDAEHEFKMRLIRQIREIKAQHSKDRGSNHTS
jgi:alpha-amylase/alpha-mannosidase (GH57 family)